MKITSPNFWYRFADYINGDFIEAKYDQSDKVITDYKGWKIVFDNHTLRTMSGGYSYEQNYTRITALMETIDNFRFEIYPQNMLNTVAKFFGSRDVTIGDVVFDKEFIIKSDNEVAVKQLLLQEPLKIAIEHCNHFNLQISDRSGIWGEKLAEGKLELAYFSKGKKETFETLNAVGEIFKLTLDQLYKIRSIGLQRE